MSAEPIPTMDEWVRRCIRHDKPLIQDDTTLTADRVCCEDCQSAVLTRCKHRISYPRAFWLVKVEDGQVTARIKCPVDADDAIVEWE